MVKEPKKSLGKSVHTYKRAICKGVACQVEFPKKRKDQVFCSSQCRLNYFNIARGLGTALLEKSRCNPGLKAIINSLIKEGKE
jgi:hypothetical protein